MAVVAGSATVLLGGRSIPDAGEPSASLDSELRFYAVWWIGAGLFVIWLAPRLRERTRELRVFCALLFLAGLSRVFAILDSGWPSTGQVVLMVVELVLAVALVVWQARATARAAR